MIPINGRHYCRCGYLDDAGDTYSGAAQLYRASRLVALDIEALRRVLAHDPRDSGGAIAHARRLAPVVVHRDLKPEKRRASVARPWPSTLRQLSARRGVDRRRAS